jgi:hypothetical protein
MRGEAGKDLRFRNPSALDEALNIATDVYNERKLESHHRERELIAVKTEDRNLVNMKEQGVSKRSDKQYQGSQGNRFHGTCNGNRDRVRNSVV